MWTVVHTSTINTTTEWIQFCQVTQYTQGKIIISVSLLLPGEQSLREKSTKQQELRVPSQPVSVLVPVSLNHKQRTSTDLFRKKKINWKNKHKTHSVKIWLLRACIKPRCPLQLVHKKTLKMHLRHWSCWLLGQACGWWRWRSLLGWTLGQSGADQLDQPKARSRDTHHFEWAEPKLLVFRQSNTAVPSRAITTEFAVHNLHFSIPQCHHKTCKDDSFCTTV